jgi:Kef-type K+ transport system membrane component KefB
LLDVDLVCIIALLVSGARGAFLLPIGLVVVAQLFGLGVILGAFFAGAVLRLLDRDEMMTRTGLRTKLRAVGFGVFIPFFFLTSGMQLGVRTLLRRSSWCPCSSSEDAARTL